MNKKNNKPNLAFQIFINIFQMLVIALLLVVMVLVFGTKINFLANKGFNFYAVISGSMEPAIPVGAVIKVGKYELESLKEGDIITYQIEESVVTHRITKAEKDKKIEVIVDGEEQKAIEHLNWCFITKGDANNAEDAYEVKPKDILGKYEWHIPYLGYISAFAQTQFGFIALIIIPATILILWEVISLVLHFTSAKSVQSNQEVKKLKEELAKEKAKNKKEE